LIFCFDEGFLVYGFYQDWLTKIMLIVKCSLQDRFGVKCEHYIFVGERRSSLEHVVVFPISPVADDSEAKLHFVAGQGPCFICKDMLNHTKLLVQGARHHTRWTITNQTVHFYISVHEPCLSYLD
jgi:hypothetical protein